LNLLTHLLVATGALLVLLVGWLAVQALAKRHGIGNAGPGCGGCRAREHCAMAPEDCDQPR